ncbi:MAG: hypothetical protein FWF75_09585 [Propionibacteriaceae bacterium]|nr:hypothetical protein [Propionibacteriaceae bacterium]
MSPVSSPFGRLRRRIGVSRDDRSAAPGLREHLDRFVATRTGVEAWVEPETGFNRASILLVAGDGEWTRRTVPSPRWAEEYARKAGLRSYPAGVVGYPQRMRDWDIQHRP